MWVTFARYALRNLHESLILVAEPAFG